MELKNYCRPESALPGLRDLIVFLPEKTVMVEIGSFAGESAEEFLKHSKIAHLHSIDPWVGGYDKTDPASENYPLVLIEREFDERMKPFAGRVTKHRMTSVEAIHLFPDHSLDFVYIDALHTYEGAKTDINMWRRKVKAGGLVGGMTTCQISRGVIRAVNMLLASRTTRSASIAG